MFKERVDNIVEKMKQMELDYIIMSDPISIFYSTGIEVEPGERLLALILDQQGNKKLFVNQLFPLKSAVGLDIVWHSDIDKPISQIAEYLSEDTVIGIDKNWPARFLLELWEQFPKATYKNGSLAVDQVRMLKDENEKFKMIVASGLNDQVMDKVQEFLYEGVTEIEVVEFLRNSFNEEEAVFSFHPIVCFGSNAANPHHESGNRTLKSGDTVILDIGCKKDHYCSDMTRTVFFKSIPDEAERVYNLVREANRMAIEAVQPGVRFCDIDNAARSVICEGGYGPYFLHRTGHSIGLEVHDYGDVSSINEDVIEEGMIFSIEPGIYLEERFGVRIEDLVLVTKDGCLVLNSYSKEVKVVG